MMTNRRFLTPKEKGGRGRRAAASSWCEDVIRSQVASTEPGEQKQTDEEEHCPVGGFQLAVNCQNKKKGEDNCLDKT